MPFRLSLLAFLVIWSLPVQAQDGSDRTDRIDYLAVPTLIYTPETKLGVGFGAALFLKNQMGPPSSVQTTAIYTFRKQFIANLYNEFYSPGGRVRFWSESRISRFPNTFYGIGPYTRKNEAEDYSSDVVFVTAKAQWKAWKHLRLGPMITYRGEEVTRTDTAGVLQRGLIPGSTHGTVLAGGFSAAWDSRDNIFYTRSGIYSEVTISHAPEAAGNDYLYTRYTFDLRGYLPVFRQQALAAQVFVHGVEGRVPFALLPVMGGSMMMRGYIEGRYRDNVAVLSQAEYRFPITSWLRAAMFTSAGKVAPALDGVYEAPLRLAAGAGLRLRLNDQGAHIRVDFARGQEGTGFYFTAMEAF